MSKPQVPHYTERLRDSRKASNQFYDFLTGDRFPPPMLVIIKHDGNEQAFNYYHLSKRIMYNPSEGIRLSFIDSEGEVKIRIEGRNLDELWKHLITHRVTSISEAGPDAAPDIPESELCVEKITIQ